jgi:hypothetical protein
VAELDARREVALAAEPATMRAVYGGVDPVTHGRTTLPQRPSSRFGF